MHAPQQLPTPNCIGAYELIHTRSQLRLVGVATDLAHAKRHHLEKLHAQLHENQELQEHFSRDPELDFVPYPAPNRACAQALCDALVAAHTPAGRLFAAAQHCVQPVPRNSNHYNA